MTQTTMDAVVAQVKAMGAKLRNEGWMTANAVGELCTPDGILWFSTVYVTGEYTVHAFHREKGAGPARGNIRVRMTPALIEAHPNLWAALTDDLVRAGTELRNHGFAAMEWPPPIWATMSHEGVVDHR